MVLQNQRLDITDGVTGKLDNGQINLYHQSQPIGRIVLSDQKENTYELKEGYEYNGNKIFHQEVVTTEPDQKYVDCDDENGWC